MSRRTGVTGISLFFLMGFLGCRSSTVPRVPEGTRPSTHLPCRKMTVSRQGGAGNTLTWWSAGPGTDQDAWCRAVGPPLLSMPDGPRESSGPPSLSELAIISWNVHAGGGDVEALIRDLRSGRLDGQPTEAFVLLLQEAFRRGSEVPSSVDSRMRWADRVDPGPVLRGPRSIDSLAHRNGLDLFYLPSMRNGGQERVPEDRGNAILSSIPLTDLSALELPMERQRRVVAAARVSGVGLGEEPVDVLLVNLHLAPRSRWREFQRSLGAGRTNQARAVVERFGEEPVVVMGGDLNTWFGGPGEGAFQLLLDTFPSPGVPDWSPTVSAPGPLPDLLLDHIFFRLPPGYRASYEVVEERYGSDHHPVLGRFR